MAGATDQGVSNAPGFSVLATFSGTATATEAFEAAAKELEPDDRLTLFGQSVFLSGAPADGKWPKWFEALGGKVVTEQVASNVSAVVSLSCLTPDEATADALALDCDAYFTGNWTRMWPPWADFDSLTPAQARAARDIQHTRLLLHKMENNLSHDPDYLRQSARRRSDLTRKTLEETRSFADQMLAAQWSFYRRELGQLTISNDDRLDKEFAVIYGNYLMSTNDEASEQALKAMQESRNWRLGTLPMTNGRPASPEAWRAASNGIVSRRKTELNIRWLEFYRTDLGLPALVEYLHRRGCTQIRYELTGISSDDDIDSDK